MIRCKSCGVKVSRCFPALYCFNCLAVRRRIRDRKNRNIKKGKIEKECIFCNDRETLNIHHKDMNRNNNTKENLIYVCLQCHKIIHYQILKPFLKLYAKKSKRQIAEI